MVATSKRLYDAFVSREGILDYTSLLLSSISAVCVREECKRCVITASGCGDHAAADSDARADDSDSDGKFANDSDEALPMQFGGKRQKRW
jgi:hypothetical protein